MFDAAVEALVQGNTQQQFHTWHSTACARENLCVKCVRVQVKKVIVCVRVCLSVKVK